MYEALDGGMLLLYMLLEVFTQRNFVADFIRLKVNVIQKTRNRLLSHHLGDFGVTYVFHLLYSSLETPWSTTYSS